MFTITHNKEIRISRGDDSGRFPLFLNKGTNLNPIRYKIPPEITVSTTSATIKNINVDTVLFKEAVQTGGTYQFVYNYSRWLLNGQTVELSTYGITFEGESLNADTITVIYASDLIEVYLYVSKRNGGTSDFIFKKTFNANGLIRTQSSSGFARKETVTDIINEYGDMMLLIDSADTASMEPGEYMYFILVKILDPETGKYVLNTVTYKVPFYVIDDDYDRA